MNSQDSHSFSSVLSINPYEKTSFSGISSYLKQIKSPEFSKDQYVISYLNNKDFITSQISISKNIPGEDLYDAIYNKVYDELALDQAILYKIQYIETFNNLDENNRYFHVFVVNPLTVNEIFEDTIKNIKYIDTIIPTPLLLKSLYSKNIIDDNGAHCFIYFQKNETFISVYNNKEFVYTKSISYSHTYMHERFCELYGEQISYEDFIKFLKTENLKESQSNYKEYFIKLYKEIFANINDILTYIKRAFEIDKIDQIYIGSQLPTVTKMDEISEVELNVRSSDFNFDYGFETDGEHINQLHSLMHIYTTLDKDERYECNFTSYFRPSKFIKRNSGRLIIVTAAALFLAFIYPLTYWVLSYAQSLQYDMLKKDYMEIHSTKITREATIKNKLATKEKISILLTQSKKEFTDKKGTLIKIHDVKVNYPMKALLLSKLTKDLNAYNVKLKYIDYKEDEKSKNFNLHLTSSQEDKITKLLKYLVKTYENKFKFSLEEISYKEKDKKYISELKVEIL